MTKWEYQFLIAEKYGKGIFGFVLPKEISWKIHYINGKQQQNGRMLPFSIISTKWVSRDGKWRP